MTFAGFGATATNADTSATPSVAAPEGAVATDYQLIVLSIASSSADIGTVPAAWAVVANLSVAGSGAPDRGGTNRLVVLESSTAGTAAFSITITSARVWHAVRANWHLPAGSTGRTVAAASIVYPAASATNAPVSPAVTPTAPDSLAITVGAMDTGPASNTVKWSSLDGYTQRYNRNIGVSGGEIDGTAERQCIVIGDREVATPGTAVSGTFGLTDVEEPALVQVVLNGVSSKPTPTAVYTIDATSTVMETPTFTPAAGEVIVVKAGTGDTTYVPLTCEGGGIDFPSLVWIDGAAFPNYCGARLWVGVVGALPSPMTVKVTLNQYSSSVPASIVVERWPKMQLSDQPVINTPLVGSGGPSSIVTTTNPNSIVTWLVADWNGASGAAAYRGTVTETYQRRIASAINIFSAWQDAPTPGDQVFGLSTPNQKWCAVGVELQVTAARPGPEPGRMLLAVA